MGLGRRSESLPGGGSPLVEGTSIGGNVHLGFDDNHGSHDTLRGLLASPCTVEAGATGGSDFHWGRQNTMSRGGIGGQRRADRGGRRGRGVHAILASGGRPNRAPSIGERPARSSSLPGNLASQFTIVPNHQLGESSDTTTLTLASGHDHTELCGARGLCGGCNQCNSLLGRMQRAIAELHLLATKATEQSSERIRGVGELEDENGTLRQQQAKIAEEKERLKKDRESLERERKEQEEQRNLFEAEKEQLRSDKTKLTKENTKLKREKTKLEKEKKKLEEDKAELKKRVEALERAQIEKDRRIAALEEEVAQADRDSLEGVHPFRQLRQGTQL